LIDFDARMSRLSPRDRLIPSLISAVSASS
jgi:hypothetical protein